MLSSPNIPISEARRLHDALVAKFGLSLKVPVSTYLHSEGAASSTLPYLKPTDLFTVLLSQYPWLLFGGYESESEIETTLETFWSCYRKEHPRHDVFEHSPERLRRTFPVTCHGDGGRTQKKQPLEIFSIQPVLGLNSHPACNKSRSCTCATSVCFGGGAVDDATTQALNSKHSTYLTHFLCFAYPSKKYSLLFANLLNSFLREVMSDLGKVCEDGIESASGQTFYPAVIGFKLDMEWMAKVGSLVRSYQNVGHVNTIPCCHECDAGQARIPFEDVNASALWTTTRFNTVPWRNEPPWRSVPFDRMAPAKF